MPITTISSHQFNQDPGKAKNAAKEGPVIITDRGQPAHVLLTYKDYQKLTGGGPSLVEMLAMPGAEDIEFEIPISRELVRVADFS